MISTIGGIFTTAVLGRLYCSTLLSVDRWRTYASLNVTPFFEFFTPFFFFWIAALLLTITFQVIKWITSFPLRLFHYPLTPSHNSTQITYVRLRVVLMVGIMFLVSLVLVPELVVLSRCLFFLVFSYFGQSRLTDRLTWHFFPFSSGGFWEISLRYLQSCWSRLHWVFLLTHGAFAGFFTFYSISIFLHYTARLGFLVFSSITSPFRPQKLVEISKLQQKDISELISQKQLLLEIFIGITASFVGSRMAYPCVLHIGGRVEFANYPSSAEFSSTVWSIFTAAVCGSDGQIIIRIVGCDYDISSWIYYALMKAFKFVYLTVFDTVLSGFEIGRYLSTTARARNVSQLPSDGAYSFLTIGSWVCGISLLWLSEMESQKRRLLDRNQILLEKKSIPVGFFCTNGLKIRVIRGRRSAERRRHSTRYLPEKVRPCLPTRFGKRLHGKTGKIDSPGVPSSVNSIEDVLPVQPGFTDFKELIWHDKAIKMYGCDLALILVLRSRVSLYATISLRPAFLSECQFRIDREKVSGCFAVQNRGKMDSPICSNKHLVYQSRKILVPSELEHYTPPHREPLTICSSRIPKPPSIVKTQGISSRLSPSFTKMYSRCSTRNVKQKSISKSVQISMPKALPHSPGVSSTHFVREPVSSELRRCSLGSKDQKLITSPQKPVRTKISTGTSLSTHRKSAKSTVHDPSSGRREITKDEGKKSCVELGKSCVEEILRSTSANLLGSRLTQNSKNSCSIAQQQIRCISKLSSQRRKLSSCLNDYPTEVPLKVISKRASFEMSAGSPPETHDTPLLAYDVDSLPLIPSYHVIIPSEIPFSKYSHTSYHAMSSLICKENKSFKELTYAVESYETTPDDGTKIKRIPLGYLTEKYAGYPTEKSKGP